MNKWNELHMKHTWLSGFHNKHTCRSSPFNSSNFCCEL